MNSASVLPGNDAPTVITNGARGHRRDRLEVALFSSNVTFCAYFAVVSWKIGVDINV